MKIERNTTTPNNNTSNNNNNKKHTTQQTNKSQQLMGWRMDVVSKTTGIAIHNSHALCEDVFSVIKSFARFPKIVDDAY